MNIFSPLNAVTYFPAQPEIERNSDYYLEKKPNSYLCRQSIAVFYQFKVKQNHAQFISIIPDGAFDLLFCCDPPPRDYWQTPY